MAVVPRVLSPGAQPATGTSRDPPEDPGTGLSNQWPWSRSSMSPGWVGCHPSSSRASVLAELQERELTGMPVSAAMEAAVGTGNPHACPPRAGCAADSVDATY